MKELKTLLLITLASSSLLLGACARRNKPTPSESEPRESEPVEPSDETEIDTSNLDPEDQNQTFNFYLDYSHSDEPIYTMTWWAYVPLGKCPDAAKLKDSDASDPLFPHFIGYSRYPSSIDDTNIWHFATDSALSSVVNLYGIWVSND